MEGVAEPEAIDTIAKLGFAHPLGPLALADLIGLDTCVAIMDVLHEGSGDPKYAPCPLLRQYVPAGRLGRKSGRGFYSIDLDPWIRLPQRNGLSCRKTGPRHRSGGRCACCWSTTIRDSALSCGRRSRTSRSRSTRPATRPRPSGGSPTRAGRDRARRRHARDGRARLLPRAEVGPRRTRAIRVVLLTGMEDVEDVAGAAGADALLLKPFRPLELLGVVERLAGAASACRCGAPTAARRGAARPLRARPPPPRRARARPARAARERLPRDGVGARDRARHEGHRHAPALAARPALRARARRGDRPASSPPTRRSSTASCSTTSARSACPTRSCSSRAR